MTSGRQYEEAREKHLSVDELALLAERGTRAALDEPAIRHLARCRSCMAAYTDAVRYRAAWLASPEMFESASGPPLSASNWRAPRSAQLMLAAGLIAAVGIGAYVTSRRPVPSHQVSGPIAALLEAASGADIIYPGSESGASLQATPYRSGTVASDQVQFAIDSLRTRYENGSRTIPELYDLAAALTASGRLDLAHDYVTEGRALQPGSPRFLVLAAILARRQGDADEAARLIREARKLAPRDLTVMLDHAILLAEAGAMAGAEPMLREVIRRAPGSALAARAERVLRGPAPR